MYTLISCLTEAHDWRLVIAAAIVCLVGSITTMLLLSRVQECAADQRRQWIAMSAILSGIGIWATHFIAMLAYDGALPVRYNLGLTVFSVAVAIAGSWLAFAIAFRNGTRSAFAIGGVILALGIAGMHFTGMQAIEAQARVEHAAIQSMVAVILCIVFAAAALVAFRQLRGGKRIAAGATLLLLSICLLHFVSMSGTALVPDPQVTVTGIAIPRPLLASIVILASMILIFAGFAAVFLDRHVTDLRDFANASLEGMLIVRDGQILDSNERLLEMTGWEANTLIHQPPEKFLLEGSAVGGRNASDGPCETELLMKAGGQMPVQLLRRTIGYRGRECQVYVVRDLTERNEAERKIEHLAHHDALTDLPNRTLFDIRINQALQMARRNSTQVALFCIDLDRFKAVNDIFGHAEGDRILRKVTDILRQTAGINDTVARLGGDEFAIIQTDVGQPDGARQLAERLLEGFAREMDMDRDPTAVGVSVGISVYPADGNSPEQLCYNADTALYRVKHSGRGNACFFDAEMDLAVRTRRQLESDLRQAISRQQLHVSYQPIVETQTLEVTGYEAFARWNHPSVGLIEPDVFIPIAEESGSIVPLGEWILEQACVEAALWPLPLTIAVNVSPVQFRLPNLYEMVVRTLAKTKLPPNRLELEITEAALIHDHPGVIATLMRLRALGIKIVMDDFGTGYSSLSNLRAFPFDKLKVDRSFTSALEHDPAAQSIVRAIIGLGRSLGMPVVTEGVETEAQRRLVADEGCAQVQGLLFGKPDIEPSIKFSKRSLYLRSQQARVS